MNVAIFMTLLIAAFGASVRYGGSPERWTGAMFIAATLLSHLLYREPGIRYSTVELAVALIDVMLLAGVTVILLRADRFWPIALFATQGVTVLSHVVKALDATINRHAYVIAIVGPSYAALLILVVATVRHQRRLKARGWDFDWSHSPPSVP